LLASNNGGQTWKILDTRQAELFSERHQRRVFQTRNRAAFNLYRLQIDRVREPDVAHAVQLAELEPLGEPGDGLDPRPIFADAITAQGDNPPFETAFQAFDGRPETKWLDVADVNGDRRSSWIQWRYLDKNSLVITNLEQLHLLGSEAREGYPLKVEGVLVGNDPASNQWWVLDPTGCIQVSDVAPAPQSVPGQRVLLEGRSQWVNHQAGIGQSVIVAQGPAAVRQPSRIVLGQPVHLGEGLTWVEVEGSVRFRTQPEDRMEFELVDNEQSLSVRILDFDKGKKLPPIGTRVRLQGVCSEVLNASGERVPGILWASDLNTLAVVDQSEAPQAFRPNFGVHDTDDQNATLLTDIRQIRRLDPDVLLRHPRCGSRAF